MCEDWYHGRHLGLESTPDDRFPVHFASFYNSHLSSSYAEMICRGCVKQHPFLAHYTGLAVKEGERNTSRDETPGVDDNDQEANPDVEALNSGTGNSFAGLSFYNLLYVF